MVNDRPTLRQGIRALPRPVWILCAGTFVNRFGSFVAVFLVLYLRDRGYSIAESGLVVSFYGIGNVVAAAVGGWVADRFGRRNALALSMFGSAATLLLLSQAASLPLIIVLTTLAGLTGEMYRPAAAALITDLTPAGERIPAFALNRLAINAGFAAGPAGRRLAGRAFLLPPFPRRCTHVRGVRSDLPRSAARGRPSPAGRRATRRGDPHGVPRPPVPLLPHFLGPRRLRLLSVADDLSPPREGQRAFRGGLRPPDLAERPGDRVAGAAARLHHPAFPLPAGLGARLGPRRARLRPERRRKQPARARLHRARLDARRDRLRTGGVRLRRRHRARAPTWSVPGSVGIDLGACIRNCARTGCCDLRLEPRRTLACVRSAWTPCSAASPRGAFATRPSRIRTTRGAFAAIPGS